MQRLTEAAGKEEKMNRQLIRKVCGSLLSAALVVSTCGTTVGALETGACSEASLKGTAQPVPLTTEVFKDAGVLKAVKQYDADGDGSLSEAEIAKISYLSVGDPVGDVSGIEKLTSLTQLSLYNYTAETLELKTAVSDFFVYTSAPSLRIKAAEAVNISVGSYTDGAGKQSSCSTVDVSDCGNLKKLYSTVKGLTALKFPKDGGNLETLGISGSAMKTFTVPKAERLTMLSVNGNDSLTSLNLKNAKNLTSVSVTSNKKLKEVDLSKNTELTSLYCSWNAVEKLDLSKNKKLTFLDCPYNKMSRLDCSKNTKLTALNCYDNKLTTLKVAKSKSVNQVLCENNKLTTLDLSKNSGLKRVDCYGNPLKKLYIKNKTNALGKVKVTPEIASVKSENPLEVTVTLKSQNKDNKYLVNLINKDKVSVLKGLELDDSHVSQKVSVYGGAKLTVQVAGGKKYKDVLVYANSVTYKKKVTVKQTEY